MMGHLSLSPWIGLVVTSLLATLVHSHTVIVYPGWRGNTLHTNGTVQETEGLGIASNGSDLVYPYGMQWSYPCGGMPRTTNRTKWPVTGGAVAFQPGWFSGHKTAFIYVNLGLGTIPRNMSHPMATAFQLNGPHADPYPGTFCLPQVRVPEILDAKVGDNATIQVIETAVHGAALYNCVDITFAEPGDEEITEVTRDNCFNSTNLTAKLVYSMDSESAASINAPIYSTLATIPLLLAGYYFNLMI